MTGDRAADRAPLARLERLALALNAAIDTLMVYGPPDGVMPVLAAADTAILVTMARDLLEKAHASAARDLGAALAEGRRVQEIALAQSRRFQSLDTAWPPKSGQS